jgi:hypothetical protein
MHYVFHIENRVNQSNQIYNWKLDILMLLFVINISNSFYYWKKVKILKKKCTQYLVIKGEKHVKKPKIWKNDTHSVRMT